jgi:DNA-binding IclR family transcriptional regulator
MRLPAAFTASGKAILATLPPERVAELVGSQVNNPNAWGQRKQLHQLVEELQATRQRGYSIDDEETARGMTCIGAPIFAGSQREAVGAVAMSLVKSTATWFDTRLSEYVRHIAGDTSRRMGADSCW